MAHTTRIWILCAALVGACLTHASHAQTLGTELVINGDFETGDLTGWTNNGLNITTPGSSGVNGLDDASDIGAFVVTGSTGPVVQNAHQDIDVSAHASLIDAGNAVASFGALLQSRRAGTGDTAIARLEMRGASGSVLGSLQLEDPPDGQFDWGLYEDTVGVVSGTRTLRVVAESTRQGGGSSDSYIDNVSVTLDAVPAPGALAVLAIGAPLAGRRRR